MGAVREIYLSKLSEVQQKLQTAAGRAGMKAPTFYQALEEAQNAYESEAAPSSQSVLADSPAPVSYTTGSATAPVSVRSDTYDAIVQSASAAYGLEPNLIKAVIQAESSFRPEAVSVSGAQGLMQLKPGTAAGLGVTNSFDPAQNILGGTAYLKKQLDRFGDLRLALAAYNTGPGAISRMSEQEDGSYSYALLGEEEQRYVDSVFSYWNTFNLKG